MKSVDKRGVRDWWLQRLSALLVLLYAPVLMVMIVMRHPVDYQGWVDVLFPMAMRVLGTMALLGLVCHAAIGFWVVATDYIKCDKVRKWTTMAMHMLITVSALVMGITLWVV